MSDEKQQEPRFHLTEFVQGEVSPRGERVFVKARTADGQVITLKFDGGFIGHFAQWLEGLAGDAEAKHRATADDLQIIRTIATRAAGASPSLDGSGAVVLTLQSRQGMEFHFSVPVELVDPVCKRLQKAARESRPSSSLRSKQ